MIEPEVGAELEGLTARLHADGWADHVTVERLMHDWRQLAGEVADYPMTIDDYTNDVTARDGLDLVLKWTSDRAREVVGDAISEADETFKASTVDDGGDAVSRYFRIGDRAGWWWRRRPTTGRLAAYLDRDR